jgi:aspartyl-tRNA(Asn)/glutamyl-tRNA(Gln) amidotransferase subunit B
MAELPVAKRERYLSLGLPKADVLILADELATADFFDAAMAAGAPAKAAANWIMGDIMAACKVGLQSAWCVGECLVWQRGV